MNNEPQNISEKAHPSSPFAQPSFADVQVRPVLALWNVPQAFFNWGASIGFALVVPLFLLLLYGGLVDMSIFTKLKNGQLTAPIMLLQLVGTFGGQILSLILSWVIVTRMGQWAFSDAIGLRWSERFKIGHALVLGLGMFALSGALVSLLPKHETDMDKFLKFGLPVRLALALVATIGAPIQEEIVYRGVLYSALEKSVGVRASIGIVSLLFWGVHVAQYWQSVATLIAVLLLSFVLTGLRAWSGKLLPCVATHLFFNGIQGVLIVVAPEKAATSDSSAQTAALILQWFGS